MSDQDASVSLGVHRPAVPVVFESATGLERQVQDVIGPDFDQLMRLRLAAITSIKEGEPQYLCAECFVPVYLCCLRSTRRFFFRHTIEDGRCGAITRGELSQDEITARKYNGVKESRLHRETKQWLEESLRASGKFLNIAQERRWTGAVTGRWRKPDVTATFGGLQIAFEVQLSTTFLEVIAQRRLFYLKEGGLLFWVFARFDDDGRRLTMDDVFYNNNANAFVVSEATRDASCAGSDFVLDCIWALPPGYRDRNPILERERIAFKDLTLDPEKQQAYYFDYAASRAELEVTAAEERAFRPQQFQDWWLEVADRHHTLYEQQDAVSSFPDDVPIHWNDGEMLTETPLRFYRKDLRLPVAILDVFYSAKLGRPVGIQRKRFIEIAHYLAESHSRYLLWFRRALEVYQRGPLLRAQDESGKWAKRVKAYKADMRADVEKYEADQTHQLLFEFLFPELCPLPLAPDE